MCGGESVPVSSQQADCLVSSSPDCHQLRWPTDLLCASLRSRFKWKPFNRLSHGLMGVKYLQWHPAHDRSSVSSGCQHTVLPVQPAPCLSVHAKPGPSQSILFPHGAVFCFFRGYTFPSPSFCRYGNQAQGTANPHVTRLADGGAVNSLVSEPVLPCMTSEQGIR